MYPWQNWSCAIVLLCIDSGFVMFFKRDWVTCPSSLAFFPFDKDDPEWKIGIFISLWCRQPHLCCLKKRKKTTVKEKKRKNSWRTKTCCFLLWVTRRLLPGWISIMTIHSRRLWGSMDSHERTATLSDKQSAWHSPSFMGQKSARICM